MTDAGLRELAKGFAGAWPYLELISTATGFRDPLDHRGTAVALDDTL